MYSGIDQLDLIDIYRTFHPTTAGYAFFTNAHRTFTKIDHILGHETNLNKFKKFKNMFFEHMELYQSSMTEKISGKPPDIWQLNGTLLNKP